MSAATNHDTVNSIESSDQVDRDIPNLTTKKKRSNIARLAVAAVMLVAVLAIAGGAAAFIQRLETQKRERLAAQAKERPKQSAAASKNFEATKKRIKDEENARLPVPSSALAAGASAIPVSQAAYSGVPAGAATSAATAVGSGQVPGQPAVPPGIALTPTQRRLSGDVLVAVTSNAIASAASTAPDLPLGAREDGSALKNGFDEKLKPSQLIAGVAAQRPDLSMLLRRGTTIQCGQYTYIRTSNPGAATCVISKDIYSANGDVLLVERGSMVFGEEREGLSQGQESIPVLWTRIDTTRGITVDINSLGTDALGSSGVPVEVDNHVMKRFGGAVMLSLISDTGQALSNRAGNSEGTIRLTTTATAGQDLATKTLENTINIPPTGYSPNGSVINILLLRDMDFRSVYELARY